jgi:hypothetical protein
VLERDVVYDICIKLRAKCVEIVLGSHDVVHGLHHLLARTISFALQVGAESVILIMRSDDSFAVCIFSYLTSLSITRTLEDETLASWVWQQKSV